MRAVGSVEVVHGLVQSAQDPESTWHSKTALASGVKANVGVLSFVVPVGPEVMVVSGAVLSAGGGVRAAGDACAAVVAVAGVGLAGGVGAKA